MWEIEGGEGDGRRFRREGDGWRYKVKERDRVRYKVKEREIE